MNACWSEEPQDRPNFETCRELIGDALQLAAPLMFDRLLPQADDPSAHRTSSDVNSNHSQSAEYLNCPPSPTYYNNSRLGSAMNRVESVDNEHYRRT